MKKKFCVFIVFALYSVLLFSVLFLRKGEGVCLDIEGLKIRLSESANLVPFKTIDNYIAAYKLGNISLQSVKLNLLGNVLLFVPMGMFLPAVSKNYKKHVKALSTIITLIIAVEISQLILGVGRMDIDDFLLNLIGALIGRLFYDIITIKSKLSQK